MTRRAPRRLTVRRETLRRLASGDLAQAAGGFIARCTYERSGCVGVPNPSLACMPEDTGGNEDTCWCL
jgi:hypothetical protein